VGDAMARRPFDRRRRGLLLAEGCGVVVLERAAAARDRGARVYGEVAGYGSVPVDVGDEAVAAEEAIAEAMQRALAAAGIGTEEVDWGAAGAGSSPPRRRGGALGL